MGPIKPGNREHASKSVSVFDQDKRGVGVAVEVLRRQQQPVWLNKRIWLYGSYRELAPRLLLLRVNVLDLYETCFHQDRYYEPFEFEGGEVTKNFTSFRRANGKGYDDALSSTPTDEEVPAGDWVAAGDTAPETPVS